MSSASQASRDHAALAVTFEGTGHDLVFELCLDPWTYTLSC